MQITIKTDSQKLFNYVEDQIRKLKLGINMGIDKKYIYFSNLEDFKEHLFQSVGLITNNHITLTNKKRISDLDFEIESGSLERNKKIVGAFSLNEKLFKH